MPVIVRMHVTLEEVSAAGRGSREGISNRVGTGNDLSHKNSLDLTAGQVLVYRDIVRYSGVHVIEIESNAGAGCDSQ